MELFQQIDWNPPLEDIVDDIFVDEEEIKDHSIMYKIISGSFKDPFVNIHTEYENIDMDMIDALLPKKQKINNENNNDKKDEKKDDEQDCSDKKKKTQYIPGLVRPSFKFPRLSRFKRSQQAMCLRVLERFSASQKPELTQTDREELEAYLALKDEVSKEQDEYLEFAKSKWPTSGFQLVCQQYMDSRWKVKINRIKDLPRYYGQAAIVPFVGNNNICIKYLTTCSTMGYINAIKLPKLAWPCILNVNSAQLNKQFPLASPSEGSLPCFKLPVSQDTHCQNIAETNAVDLVISSCGLNCLATNVGSNCAKSWILSVCVKSQNGKNVVYIDKAIPPSGNTIPDKNKWIYKYILRYFMIYRGKSKTARNEKSYEQDLFDDITAEEIIKLEEEDCEPLPPKKTDLSISQGQADNDNNSISEEILTDDKDIPKTDTSTKETLEETLEENTCTKKNEDFSPGTLDSPEKMDYQNSDDRMTGNASYHIFNIGPEPSDQSELMKNNTAKEYKILVRTKTDGFEILEGGVKQNVLLAPKLEHQVALGAEAVTLEEAMKQWISLTFRPNTVLARVRIWATKSEVLQIERRTPISISNEIKRLYNVRAEDAFTVLYNTIQALSNLAPGQYLMRHTPRDGTFATVYKETDGSGKNTFDLHTLYQNEFYTIPNPPWPALDKVVITPLHRHFGRMPATFYPLPDKYKKKKGSKNSPLPKRNMVTNKGPTTSSK